MEFKLGESGNTNGRGRPRGKSLTKYLQEMLSDNDKITGRPIKALLAEKAIKIALDDKTLAKEFLSLLAEFMDRESGKAVNMNLNADITANPFEDVDTAKLEALKAKLVDAQQKNEDDLKAKLQAAQNPPNEKKEESKEMPPAA